MMTAAATGRAGVTSRMTARTAAVIALAVGGVARGRSGGGVAELWTATATAAKMQTPVTAGTTRAPRSRWRWHARESMPSVETYQKDRNRRSFATPPPHQHTARQVGDG